MRARAALITVVVLCVGMLPAPVLSAPEPPTGEEATPLGELGLPPEKLIAPVTARPLTLDDTLRPRSRAPRIAVISSGVDLDALPEPLRQRVTPLGNAGDPIGYGTYAISVLLQLAPEATITSLGVWPDGQFNPWSQHGAFQWAVSSASDLDALLIAIPPAHFLDPVSAAMAAGEWDDIQDAIASSPLQGERGAVFGVGMRDDVFAQQTRGISSRDWSALERFRNLVALWSAARAYVRALTDAGVAVVLPAGDLGPHPQTAMGMANLPEVVAVGGYDGRGVSPTSAGGPSIQGTVKPDLLAHTGIVGLLPEGSVLAQALDEQGALDPELRPDWGAGESPTRARARLDTTLTSAAFVAAAMAGMSAEGLRDVATRRGALTAAAEPVDGAPVWRQGAGLLGRAPDRAFAESRPLALGHADLGVEPEGEWSASVPVAGGVAIAASADLADHIGTTPDARASVAPAGDDAPSLLAEPTAGGVKVSVTAADDGTAEGAFCGYVSVSFAAAGTSEEVPLCLVNAFRLAVARGFYVHDVPAADLTFVLSPALPPGASLLAHPLHLLPVDPLRAHLFSKVTSNSVDCPPNPAGARCGHARFVNVPAGYYRVRQFSDYGAPVRYEVARSDGAGTTEIAGDLGGNPSYQSFETLLLPPPPAETCPEEYQEFGDWTHPDPADPGRYSYRGCVEEFLAPEVAREVGGDPIAYDPPTAGWWVGPAVGGERLRVNAGFLRMLVGTNLASRVVDLITPCTDLEFLTLRTSSALRPEDLEEAVPGEGDAWSAGCPKELEGVVATLQGSDDGTSSVGAGVARYPFKLATPNYSARMSLNFSYDVTNAYILALVEAGGDWNIGVVTPQGSFRPPPTGGESPVDLSGLEAYGHAKGVASFDFRMLPRGAPEGTLYFVFLPPENSAVSSATIDDLSFSLSTWTNLPWPAYDFSAGRSGCAPGNVCGHVFTVASNFNPWRTDSSGARIPGGQISTPPECRQIDNGAHRATVCEDWTVLVHTPKQAGAGAGGQPRGATLMDVVDVAESRSILPELIASGARLTDPRRGVTEFRFTLAFDSTVLEAELALFPLRTNGEFWEQLSMPMGALREHPGALRVCIKDGDPGLESLCAGPDRPVPWRTVERDPASAATVAPYVPFRSEAVFLGG